jgi:hypothetical protein
MDGTSGAIVAVLFIFLAVGSIVWYYSRSRSLLERWADASGYEILNSEHRYFFRGPFFWSTSRGQSVYFVTIRDGDGHVRTGWVRCGGFFLGMLSDNTEVRWDDSR